MPHWTDDLVAKGACHEAVEWCRKYPSFWFAWNSCERLDWMAWYAGKVFEKEPPAKRKPLTQALLSCLEIAEFFVDDEEARDYGREAREILWRWSEGEASDEDIEFYLVLPPLIGTGSRKYKRMMRDVWAIAQAANSSWSDIHSYGAIISIQQIVPKEQHCRLRYKIREHFYDWIK